MKTPAGRSRARSVATSRARARHGRRVMADPRRARATVARPRAPLRDDAAGGGASVGRSVPRVEGHAKLTGTALYVDDLVVPGVLHGRTVRSTIARGRIRARSRSIPPSTGAASSVADHRDIPGENVVAPDRGRPAAARRARGPPRRGADPAARPRRSRAASRPRRARSRSTYEPLDPVLTIEESLARKALIYGDDNVFKEIVIERGDLARGIEVGGPGDRGRRTAAGHQEQLYIENNGMIAERTADGGLAVRGSLQCPYYVHKAIMRAFGLPAEQVRVVQTVDRRRLRRQGGVPVDDRRRTPRCWRGRAAGRSRSSTTDSRTSPPPPSATPR